MPVEVIGREDSVRRTRQNYTRDVAVYYTITCPECGESVEVPE